MLCFFSRMTIGTWHNMFVKGVSIASGLSYIAVFLTVCLPRQEIIVVQEKANRSLLDYIWLLSYIQELAVRLNVKQVKASLTNIIHRVDPDPGLKCTFKMQNFLVTTVLNVLSVASSP